jgi:hypothetical protein
VQPATTEPAPPGVRWLDYLGVLLMAAVIGGTIFFVVRDRRGAA